jgi:glycerol-3-phosphate O-acyltransferase/dihydroxyacetone phosphate acyltransferase
MPLFAYVGIIVSEAGMVDIKDLRPFYMRLLPSSRRRLKALPATRKLLQIDLRAFIKKVGPALGEIYDRKELDWNQIQEKSRKVSLAALQRGNSFDEIMEHSTPTKSENDVKKDK